MPNYDVYIDSVSIVPFEGQAAKMVQTQKSNNNVQIQPKAKGNLDHVKHIDFAATVYYKDGTHEQLVATTSGKYQVRARLKGRDIQRVRDIRGNYHGPYEGKPSPEPANPVLWPAEDDEGLFICDNQYFEGGESSAEAHYNLVLTVVGQDGSTINAPRTFSVMVRN